MDLIAQRTQDLSALSREDLCTLVTQLAENQRQLAVSQQEMLKEMQLMRRSMQQLIRVTPAQAAQLNRLMRETAQALAVRYRITQADNALTLLANAIRRDVRQRAGIQSMRELPRCEYEAYESYIASWDDYKAIKALRARAERR